MRVKVKCPYCGHENFIITNTENEEQILICDCEEGGCDRWFAAFAKINVQCEGKAIEGC